MSSKLSIRFLKSLCAILGLITLVACSADSDSSTASTATAGVAGVTSSDGSLSAKVPSAVSVVPTSTQTSASANPSAMIATKEIQGALGILANASTPYESDEAFEISNDPASNLFEFLSTVMGVLDYTGYYYTFDKGPVKAQFDWYAANNESSQSKLLVEAVVDSKLTNGSLPLVAETWFKVKQQGLDVKAIVTVNEAPSATNRFGKLKVNLTFTDTWHSVTGGALFEIDTNASGQLTISAKQSMPSAMVANGNSLGIQNELAAADGVVDDTANTGTLNYTNKTVVESIPGFTKGDELTKETGIITFNADYVYQKAACSVTTADAGFNAIVNTNGGPSCAASTEKLYARANPTRVAYNYGLYNKDTKKRKNVRTGMMVEYTAGNGTVYEGWSSEWGLWLTPQTPDQNYNFSTIVTPADGDTISEVTFDGTKVPYTAEIRDFKVEKELNSTINLDDLDSIELKTDTFIVDDSAIGGGSPPTTFNTRKDVVIKYDKATKKFMRVKECSTVFCWQSSQYTAITPVEHVHYVQHWDCTGGCQQKLVGLVYDFNDSRLEVKKVYSVAGDYTISNPVTLADTAASTVGLNYDVDLWLRAGPMDNEKPLTWSSATPTQAKLTNRESVSTVENNIKLVDLSWRNQDAERNCYNAFNGTSVTYLNDNADSDAKSKAAIFANHTYVLDSKMRLYKCANYADGSCVDDSKRVASIAVDLGQGSQSRCATATDTSCRSFDSIDGLVPVSELQTITLESYDDTSKCVNLKPRKYNVNYTFNWNLWSPILALKKADSTYVTYEKPLSFSVVLDGKATDLTYYGFNSSLSNWSCDQSTGVCLPEIKFIPDGTELVHKTSSGDTTYLTKALFVEESLTDVTGTATVPESLKVTAQEVSTDFTQPTYRETPTASKVCIVDRNPVDSDGNILESITGENAANFCS